MGFAARFAAAPDQDSARHGVCKRLFGGEKTVIISRKVKGFNILGVLMSSTISRRSLARRCSDRSHSRSTARQVEAVVDDRSLLSVLREDFGFTSLKNGCEPQASCGCCTLLIDGKPRLSLHDEAAQVAGKTLLTLEGLPEETRQQIADSRSSAAAACSAAFAFPAWRCAGMRLSKKIRTRRGRKSPTNCAAHLCRCTGYVKIVDAIEELAPREPRRSSRARTINAGKSARRWRSTAATIWCSAISNTSTTSPCRACRTRR